MMFTIQSSTGAPQLIIEAVWGPGKAILPELVTLDNYIFDRTADEVDNFRLRDSLLVGVAHVANNETTVETHMTVNMARE